MPRIPLSGIRDIIARMRHDDCDDREGKVEARSA
jgi:hypothetical protein